MNQPSTTHSHKREKLFTRDFVFITIANLVMAVGFYFLIALLPLFLKHELHAPESQIGLVLSMYTLAAIITRPLTGYLLDRLGRKSVYIVSFVAFTLLFLGYPMVSTIAFMLVLRFLHGATWGCMNTAGSTISIDIVPHSRRGEGIGIFGLSMTTALAIGPFIATNLARQTSFRMAFYVAFAVCVGGLLLALPVKVPKIAHSGLKFSFKGLFERMAVPASIVIMAYICTYAGVISYAGLYGQSIGIPVLGYFYIVLAVAIILTRVFAGKIYDHRGPAAILTAGTIFLLIAFPILVYMPNVWGYHISAFLLGLGFGVQMPTLQAMANEGVPANRRGASNSTFLTSFDVGMGLGLLIFGQIAGLKGYSFAYLFGMLWIVLGYILLITIALPHYRKVKSIGKKTTSIH